MLRFIGISFFFVDLIIMKFVLPLLIDSLFTENIDPTTFNKKSSDLKKIDTVG